MSTNETTMNARDLGLLRRVEAAGGECSMGYGDTSATVRLADSGLLCWWQASPLVARIAITEAGREVLAAAGREGVSGGGEH